MSQELERKFLVKGNVEISKLGETRRITQGYLSTVKERTVRVRISDGKAYLTIKGISSASGITRYEFEKEIQVSEAEELIKLCEPGIIDKMRTRIHVGSHIYEVDQFQGENKGLVLAEVELKSEDEEFEKPLWLGEEVTGDSKYYNSNLSKNPYQHW